MKERSDFNTEFKNSIEYNVCWKLRMLNKNMQTALQYFLKKLYET